MHTLWKHPNGTFYVLYGPRQRSRASLRTKDRGQADTLFAQFVAANTGITPEDPTVGDILEGYKVSRSTKVRAPNALKFAVQALKPELGALQPGHLLPHTIEKYAKTRTAAGCGAGTILREIGVLRAALAWAVEHKWIAAIPVIRNPVSTPKSRERWMPKPEARSLLAECNLPHLRLFVNMGLGTLARSGAILECKWRKAPDQLPPYVDMERRLVDYGEGYGNKRRAIVPINDELYKDLEAARRLACTDYVIEYAGRPIKTIKNAFEAACGRAKIKGVTPHILRHTGCTWLVEAGHSYEEIGKMAGDDPETIRRVYGHHSPNYLKKASAALQFLDAAE